MDLEGAMSGNAEGSPPFTCQRTSPDIASYEPTTSNQTFSISIGMEFEDSEAAYNYYLSYAKRMGFSVRKEHLRNTNERIIRSRMFVCSREGWRKQDKRDINVKVHRAETRMGCEAKMAITLYKNGKYRVSHFHPSHNHELETPSKTFLLQNEFVNVWNKLICDYEFHDNIWLKQLFQDRHKWALVYGRNTFTVDMVSTQRCESINKVLKQYLDIRQSMLSFFDNFERLVDDKRSKEHEADFNMRQRFIRVYALFEDQYKRGIDLVYEVCEESMDKTIYLVFDDPKHEHKVTFSSVDTLALCTCKKFEFTGILCRHVIQIFLHNQIKCIPDRYILQRWTREAAKFVLSYSATPPSNVIDPKKIKAERYSKLLSNFVKLSTIAATDFKAYEIVEHMCMKAYQ
ncbi:hypothetical protein Taro_007800 [Colocasia esculenta]|uniref:Protein FAR1-RELATED SEQUENCE n=1 Tax=Colocasia esculenta TaxID=4460 RepID=A0A843U546_COLES|nr:hypothetical protein [Colocasia esculenta]